MQLIKARQGKRPPKFKRDPREINSMCNTAATSLRHNSIPTSAVAARYKTVQKCHLEPVEAVKAQPFARRVPLDEAHRFLKRLVGDLA